LQNGFPIWNDLFEDYSDYEAYILPVEKDAEYAYILKIKFHSENDVQKFIKANSPQMDGSIITKFKRLSSNELIFIESNFPEQEVDGLLMD